LKQIFLVILLVFFALGQSNKFTVRSIEVQGNVRTDASTIRVNSGLYVGKVFTINDISEAIRNLWDLKQWKNISIDVSEITDSKEVDLVIKVEEFPRIQHYSFEGNDVFDQDELDEKINFYRGKVYTPYDIFLAKRTLQEEYKKEGHLLAEITVDTTMLKSNKLNLVFKINEGPEVQIERIRVFGADSLDSDDIVDAMEETSENNFWLFGIGGDFDSKKYKEDLVKVTEYIQNQGFRNGGLIRDSIYYSKDGEEMYIDLYVQEGKQFFFGDIVYKGNSKISDLVFENNVELQKGEPYSQKKFIDAREKIRQLYHDMGHLFAQISPRETINGDTINITYTLQENNPVKIRGIHILGNTKTQERVIRRNIKIFPEQKYSQTAIKRAFDDINALNYFAEVRPDVKMIQNNQDYIDLEFEVKERSTDQANASIGYSERDGIIGSVGLTFNNFSLEKPFVEGGGQQIALNAQFGGFQSVYSLSFTEPYLNDTPTLIGGSFYYSRTRKDNQFWNSRFVYYDEDRQSLRLTLGRHFRIPDPFFSASISTEYSRSMLTNVDKELLERIGSGSYLANIEGKDIRTSTITLALQRNSKNNQQFPTNGSLYALSTEYNFLDKNYLKTIFKNEVYFPLFGEVIFHTGAKVGVIKRLGSNDFLLPNDLFHMGGTGMGYGTEALRGYEERTVGAPTVAKRGYSLGGDAMFKFTTELRMQVIPDPNVFALAFVEGGNVWKNIGDLNVKEVKRSAGIGARIFIQMVGIIGVDFGYGFDRFNDIFTSKANPKFEVHFQFGKF
jgi:outer membrane protein insertion porin family